MPDFVSNEATAEERHALSADELSLVDTARQPTLRMLSDAELASLIVRLGEHVSLAAEGGTGEKGLYLNQAIERVTHEQGRRAGGVTQRELAEKAMALKKAGAEGPHAMGEDGSPLHPQDPDADDGKANLAATDREVSPFGPMDNSGAGPGTGRVRGR